MRRYVTFSDENEFCARMGFYKFKKGDFNTAGIFSFIMGTE